VVTAPRLLIVQPDESDPLGPLGDWLTDSGAELDVRFPPREPVPDDLDGYGGVVCLGGGMNAEEEGAHPWISGVRDLLAKAARGGLPTLGICLGAQILAVATGGRVSPGESGPEVGAGLVAKKDAAWTDPLFAELPLMPDVMQFHSDAITALPPGAVLLASSPRYSHQAFRLHRAAYGVQFHIETSPEIVQSWAHEAPTMAAAARPGAFETETLTTVHADIAQTWRPFAARFVQLCAGTLDPASPRPTLPLA
jgi:GMP synthase-like glutamine amidotransferase